MRSYRRQLGYKAAQEIRRLYFRKGHPSRRELSLRYGCSYCTVSHILLGRIWTKPFRRPKALKKRDTTIPVYTGSSTQFTTATAKAARSKR